VIGEDTARLPEAFSPQQQHAQVRTTNTGNAYPMCRRPLSSTPAEKALTYSDNGIYNCRVARASTTSDPFNAIAEPRRRDILEFLAAEERSVSEIVDEMELNQPSVSKHLQVLREVGLVTARREGKHIRYRTNAEGLRAVHEWSAMFARYWRRQLRRIKTHAEGQR
jgi:DNA-binding transcriptional ArsR family regulator